jgi:nitrogen fixation protein NifU and related proteins
MNTPNETVLERLYQQVILEHYRKPRNRGTLDEPGVTVHLSNPTCGDTISLALRVQDGRIEQLRFTGEGCAISQAAASMMTGRIQGETVEEGLRIRDAFLELLHGRGDPHDRALGDMRAFAGVARFPARVRCALLAWDALGEATRSIDVDAGQEQGESTP